MVVAVFHVELPELRGTLVEVPDVAVRIADVRDGPGSNLAVLVWASGDGRSRFDAVVDDDPSLGCAVRLADDGGRWLYRLEFGAGPSMGIDAYRALVSLDGLLLEGTGSRGTWRVRVLFPDRAALSAFYDRCREIGLEPRVSSVAIESATDSGSDFGLTEPQRRALVEAARRGYFDVPKGISLVDLADAIGVSDQAVSERLRRGMQTLVAQTLLDADPGDR